MAVLSTAQQYLSLHAARISEESKLCEYPTSRLTTMGLAQAEDSSHIPGPFISTGVSGVYLKSAQQRQYRDESFVPLMVPSCRAAWFEGQAVSLNMPPEKVLMAFPSKHA